MNDALVPYKDIEQMANQVVKSRMFAGINTPEAAITLMLLCQSEGLHPMQAMMRYHMIQGRPSMKADAMLSEFMRRGGTVKWIEWTNEACEAEFKSSGCPDGVKVRWTMDDAKRAGVTGNPTWTKYPRQMLKARVSSDGVRMADPAVNQGRYTPEEVQDFEPQRKPADYELVGGEPNTAAPVEVAPETAPPAIESASNPGTTEEWLRQAKENREAAAKWDNPKRNLSPGQQVTMGDEPPPHEDRDAPPETFEQKLERERAAKFPKRPAGVPEFCEMDGCGMPVSLHESATGGAKYYECNFRHAERHKMLEAGESKANIKEVLKGHFEVKYAGKAS